MVNRKKNVTHKAKGKNSTSSYALVGQDATIQVIDELSNLFILCFSGPNVFCTLCMHLLIILALFSSFGNTFSF